TIDPAAKGVTGSTAYDPFGKPTASAGATNSLGYQSGWTDPASGDVNMAARWYRPGSGTFASRDSWQLGTNPSVQGNRFTYGNGDPIDSTDPSGHCPFCIPILIHVVVEGSILAWELYSAEPAQGPGVDRTPPPGSDKWSGYNTRYCESHPFVRSCGGSGWQGSPSPTTSPAPPVAPVFSPAPTGGGGHSGGSGARRNPAPHRRPSPRQPPGPTLPKPKPPTDTRPINDNDRPHANPDPIDFFTDTIVTVGTAVVSSVVVEGAPVVVGTATVVGSGIVAGTDALFDLADELFPDPAPTPRPRPVPAPEDDSGDCRALGGGWRTYQPVDKSGRAQGAEACLTKDFIDNNRGTGTKSSGDKYGDDAVTPPGYTWAAIYATSTLGNPGKAWKWRNNCHLLAGSLGGSGTNYENLATCSRTANSTNMDKAWPPHRGPNMAFYESRVKMLLDSDPTAVIHYKVTPKYAGSRIVPTDFHMQATLYKPGVGTMNLFEADVANEMYRVKDGQWYNLGKNAPTQWEP
ncbi:RHS repeat-associated core domain-containing protein, partial [Kitasatospora sp. NPDC098663]|uniref:RHS repeat-associated core domain-containing protein n=1 Tax=Kitasatospora sp. NPDC098663 TaxID=3364096 RepID=UPI0037FA01CA